MIVITAPTGDIGHRVVDLLIDGDEPLRLVARDASNIPASVRARVDVVEGSHRDTVVVAKAFDGAGKVFWLVPSDSTADSAEAAYVDFARPAVDVLKESSVTHIVSISALGRGWPTDAGHASATIRMDDMFAATGVNYAALACASLMSNIARQTELIKAQGTFYYPAPGNLKLPHVAPQDVASVSVRLVQDTRSWSGFQDLPLLGPEDLTFDEMASIMSSVLGRDFVFNEMPMDAMGAMMIEQGGSKGMAQAMVDMLTAKSDGLDHMVARTPEVTATCPTTFRQWCESDLKPAIEA